MSKLVYLAGPIVDLAYEACTGWREYAIEEFRKDGITGLSPMRSKDFLKQHPKLLDGISQHALASDSGITTRDHWDVMRCDAVLFNLLKAPKVSIGTMIEYGWASAYNKPIVTVMEKKDGDNKNIHEHCMIRRLSAYNVPTLDEGLGIVRALFAY